MKRNKKLEKTQKTEKLDSKNKRIITVTAVCLGIAALGVMIFALVYPFAKISKDFDRLMNDIEGMRVPSVVITDMLADNVFSESAGEVMINDAEQTEALLSGLCSVAREMKYSGKDTETIGTWDIRLTVSEENVRVTVYLAEDRMYYTVGSVKYYFAPNAGEDEKAYQALYGDVCKLVGKTE